MRAAGRTLALAATIDAHNLKIENKILVTTVKNKMRPNNKQNNRKYYNNSQGRGSCLPRAPLYWGKYQFINEVVSVVVVEL